MRVFWLLAVPALAVVVSACGGREGSKLDATALETASRDVVVPTSTAGSVPTATPTPRPGPVGTTVVATIDLSGSDSISLAVNPETNRIYAADFIAGTLSLIDGDTAMVSSTLDLDMAPQDVAVNVATNRVYVLGRDDLVVVDGASHRILARSEVCGHAAANSLTGLAVDPATDHIYVAHDTCGALFVVDGRTNQVSATVKVDGLAGVRGVAVNPATKRVYIANDRRLHVVDLAARAVVDTISAEQFVNDVAVNPVANWIYAAGEPKSLGLDGVTHDVSDFGRPIDAERVVVDSLANRSYFVSSSGILGWVIDPPGSAAQFEIDVYAGPVGISDMALDPITKRLFLTNGLTVWVVELASDGGSNGQ